METWTKRTAIRRERGIEHLYRTIDDPLIPILARVISRPNRGSYGNRVGDTSHKWDRLTVNASIYIYIYKMCVCVCVCVCVCRSSPAGSRRAFSLFAGPDLSKNKQLKLGGLSLSWHHSRVVPL